MAKLKRDLKYRSHVYFESVLPHIVYQALTYLKPYNKFFEDISITKGLSSEDIINFFDIVEVQGQSECFDEKNVSDGKEMAQNINIMLLLHGIPEFLYPERKSWTLNSGLLTLVTGL